MIVIVTVDGIASLVGDYGSFSPVELFLSSREPFALPPPHLKKENRISISIYCQMHHIFMFLPFLHNPDTCFKDKSHHRWLWWLSSNLHFLIIIEKYIWKAKATLLLLATLQFLRRWKWSMLGLHNWPRISTNWGKNSTGSQNSPPFCYLLPCNFLEDGSV